MDLRDAFEGCGRTRRAVRARRRRRSRTERRIRLDASRTTAEGARGQKRSSCWPTRVSTSREARNERVGARRDPRRARVRLGFGSRETRARVARLISRFVSMGARRDRAETHVDGDEEESALVRRVSRPDDGRVPVEDVVVRSGPRAARRRGPSADPASMEGRRGRSGSIARSTKGSRASTRTRDGGSDETRAAAFDRLGGDRPLASRAFASRGKTLRRRRRAARRGRARGQTRAETHLELLGDALRGHLACASCRRSAQVVLPAASHRRKISSKHASTVDGSETCGGNRKCANCDCLSGRKRKYVTLPEKEND